MPLHCTSCGYPAPQTLTCPECGRHDFETPGLSAARRGWPLLIAFVLLHGASKLFGMAHAVLDYHASMKNFALQTATTQNPRVVPTLWMSTKEWAGFWTVTSVVALAAFLAGSIVLIFAIAIPRHRARLTLIGVLLCMVTLGVSLYNSIAQIVTLLS